MERKHFIFMLIAGLAVADLAGAAYLWSLWPSRPGMAVKAAQHAQSQPSASGMGQVLGGAGMATVKGPE